MVRVRRWLLLLMMLGSSATPAASQAPALLPKPMSVETGGGEFQITAATPLVFPAADGGAARAARYFNFLMAKGGAPRLAEQSAPAPKAIRFQRTSAGKPEAYEIAAAGDGILVTAASDAGLFYGAVTLWQLATGDKSNHIPAVTIRDAPRFGWRGLMLDSARHFQSPAYVRSLIDWMAVNKLNTLHWHLVDDQGWRVEIRKYPRLTQVSGRRSPARLPGAPPLPDIEGYYTQDEIRQIVAYAAERHINVVPEIEMPGHALAAIRAYPELGTGTPFPPGVESHWGIFPWLFNVEEPTFAFLEDVLTEVMALFPSTYIHVGGDEAVKDQWKASPAVQARMKALGIADETAMQAWFIQRIEKFLDAHGRRLIGWDEILEGGIPPKATILSWRGLEGATEAAMHGHDAVLSPAPTLYLDNRQGFGPLEPPGRGHLISLETVYAFDPLPPAIPVDKQHHILGLQGNLWTEHIRTEMRAAWMTFPRASAIAEIGWSPATNRDFSDFIDRLVPQMERMRSLGLEPAVSAFAVNADTDYNPETARATVTLDNQVKREIRYTLDGSAPVLASARYERPLQLPVGTRLRAVSFQDGRPLPGELDRTYDGRTVRRRTDEELKSCANSVVLALEDDAVSAIGERATLLVDIFKPCWRYDRAPVGGASAIAIEVGQVPFNFQVGKDVEGIKFREPRTPDGEFEVRAGSCEGELIAVLPLAPARDNPAITRLTAPITPRSDTADLCISYTARGVEPMWAVDSVELIAR